MSDKPSILEQGKEHAKAIATVQQEAPSRFVVGGSFDGQTVMGGVSYDRTWKNGWGATAYVKAWWTDSRVTPIPTAKTGVVAGAQVTKTF